MFRWCFSVGQINSLDNLVTKVEQLFTSAVNITPILRPMTLRPSAGPLPPFLMCHLHGLDLERDVGERTP
jgi:hypothetical protein